MIHRDLPGSLKVGSGTEIR